jgi:nicotinamide-nucleotide amidase
MNKTLLDSTVEQIAQVLLHHQLRLCTVESCTGGMVSAALTELAGSSKWFERGYITYSNAAKQLDLGVSMDLIQSYQC